MTADEELQGVERVLQEYRQSHLLAFRDGLEPGQRQDLVADLHRLDWPKIDHCVANYVKNPPSATMPGDLVPPQFYAAEPADTRQQGKYAKALELGKNLISAGKVAAFVAAGGQGTRLGLPGPQKSGLALNAQGRL